MNSLKLSITLSLLFLSIFGSSQAIAKSIKVNIGKISDGREIIIPNNEEYLDHEYDCNESAQAVFIRSNGNKIQPACVSYGSLDSSVIPLGEGITFITDEVKYKDAVLDIDRKEIR